MNRKVIQKAVLSRKYREKVSKGKKIIPNQEYKIWYPI
jgi:hypothetical protein